MSNNIHHKLNKNDALSIILVLVIIATIAFIWGNSLESIAVSGQKSNRVLKAIAFILEPIFGKASATDHFVRKIAHFIEFCWLGICVVLIPIVRDRLSLQSVINCMFFCLSVAVIDEALQIISERGSQVKDILLDFSGASSGILFVVILHWIVNYLIAHKKP